MKPSGTQLTGRDVEILRWIGRHGIVTVDQVSARFFGRDDGTVGTWAAYRRLRKIEELQLLRRDPTFWHWPTVLRVTTAGARAADLDLSPAHLVLAEVRHSVGLVDLTEQLVVENPGSTLVTEREFRAQRFRELAEGKRRPGRGRIPDGILHLAGGRTVAIELDLTSKRQRDIERIIGGYKQERYDTVWWFIRETLAIRLRTIVAANRSDDFVEVRVWRDRLAPDTNTPAGDAGAT
jgi:hypothetical protein